MVAVRSNIILLAAYAAFLCNSAFADCGSVAGYADINRDSKFAGLFVGDSITEGEEDNYIAVINGQTKTYKDTGGFVIRLKEFFDGVSDDVRITQGAVSGYKCDQVYARLRDLIEKYTKQAKLFDFVFSKCGVNDYGGHRDSNKTRAKTQQIKRYIRKHGMYPIIANLIPTARSFQNPWVNAVNAKIKSIKNLELNSFFPLKLLDPDKIHPSAAGYDKLFELLLAKIDAVFLDPADLAPILSAAKADVDSDADGLADRHEEFQYGTNPNLADSDGDQVSDGDEACTGSDPLV